MFPEFSNGLKTGANTFSKVHSFSQILDQLELTDQIANLYTKHHKLSLLSIHDSLFISLYSVYKLCCVNLCRHISNSQFDEYVTCGMWIYLLFVYVIDMYFWQFLRWRWTPTISYRRNDWRADYYEELPEIHICGIDKQKINPNLTCHIFVKLTVRNVMTQINK